ncbi:hypothetical protein A8F94_18570 [Bacillus sp. FJAT-27225]|uniref:DUF6081 family protein n=1 Tax=Bacillus sp. FJAT-27225 TaxID=1743144 RepID=UPI00080C22B4|nr:DUF6081 family protein [Bacillus sp. FJAT-27225]OCA83133.1 hypothetical protein A8F94_18570 [Bacillus sp. FJAT-27225]
MKLLKIGSLSILLIFFSSSFAMASTLLGTTKITWDDFSKGFTEEKWFYFSAGSYIGNDGIVTTSNKGLEVVSSGKNPITGEPAFTNTLAQEHVNGGLSGGIDHVKWLAYMNNTSSKGYPGFDAVSGKELSFETWISGQTYGTQFHPFGDHIKDPNDIRLASFAFNTMDMESFMVFDFFITNNQIYAFYERLPFGRGGTLGNYAAFSYKIPVRKRNPADVHYLRISYDKDKGTVKWYVNNSEVFSVDKIGYKIDPQYMILDHGGEEQLVKPDQLVGGIGMFTLLDAFDNGKGLVKLSTEENFYYHPITGQTPLSFVDEQSLESSRLFGQGARLNVKQVNVVYKQSK